MHANRRHCGSSQRPRYTARLTILVDASVRSGAILLLLLVSGACAPKQKIQLDCIPKQVTIYVDKEPLPSVPDSIDLRADQPHILFFKGGGYESAMVVLDSEETADGPALTPRDVCLELDLIERKDHPVWIEE